jgi:hypothetical protein
VRPGVLRIRDQPVDRPPLNLVRWPSNFHSLARGRARPQTGGSWNDNTADHHHFFCEATGKLHDIPAGQLSVSGLPLPPAGSEIRRVEIIVRIHPGGVDHL